VEGLHTERSEDHKKRRLAVAALAEVQEGRRKCIRMFLRMHAGYCGEESRWRGICEEEFWIKCPVTPYRSFRRCEIEKVSDIICVCLCI
jgi:hypothetical protein